MEANRLNVVFDSGYFVGNSGAHIRNGQYSLQWHGGLNGNIPLRRSRGLDIHQR